MTIPSSAIAEIMAQSGFDLVVIDLEHSSLSVAEAGELIRTIDLAGCSPVVRLSSNDPVQIKRLLDAGAEGIIVPMVTSLEDVERAASSMFYPPTGSRGVGLGRAQSYGPGFKEYFDDSKKKLTLIAQIEHKDALVNLDAIFGSGLVDGYIVGPYDLSCSLGVPGDFEDQEFRRSLECITREGERHSVAGGLHVVEPDLEAMKQSILAGSRLMIHSVDFRIIDTVCRNAVQYLKGDLA